MNGPNATAIELSVEGANKRDAGRGIARLPESARTELGVLSGDPVIVEGDRRTVVKVWPADESGDSIRVDADTRANAGINIGDTTTVRHASVTDASGVTVQAAEPLPGSEAYEYTVRERLVDRLVQADERVHVDGLGTFLVRTTTPDDSVRVTDETKLTVLPYGGNDATSHSTSASAQATGQTDDHPAPEDAEIDVSYEDIGGLDDELDLVREMIELPLSEPERFRRLGIDPPSGVLLHGPPGTGKTLIARAVANEVDAYFDTISGPEIVSKYKGESEERLREAFERAEENAPAILFIDEIDSIAGARDDDADMENRVVAQLLTLMDGLEDRGRVVVIGATNRVDSVDEALRRGGRFDREIEIGVPDERGRREILDVHTREMPLSEDVHLDRIASRTHGFVGADVQSLTTEAAMNALRREKDEPDVSREDFESALAAVDPSAMREYVAESPTVTFDDVGGLDDAKEALTEAIEWPLTYGPLFDAARTDPPTGLLLYGPPGTGKTLLARAVAGESGVNFVHVNGPELLDRYVGESERAVRDVFDRARQTAPSIVFLDELDAIAGRRGENHEVTERVVSQLLTELDGVTDNPSLVVLAATNRRDSIDDALLRPGRLEAHVEVTNPDEAAREAILRVHTDGKPLGDDVDLGEIADLTDGVSGADLEAIVREASLAAIRSVAGDVSPEDATERAERVVISADHFTSAIESIAEAGSS